MALLERYYNDLNELQTQLEEMSESHSMGQARNGRRDLLRLSILRNSSDDNPFSSTVILQSSSQSHTQRHYLPKLKLTTSCGLSKN
ncbi:unnamed protein product [Ceratitis capitata]|uniref:(Mediterranean fruit fly) hypothetical protein n=1 Tax=Ceratitis capitata TaxID=7213 RepID=A0A811U2T7_CERCA|nr:unnamed protein product [Ceratitis capitata]